MAAYTIITSKSLRSAVAILLYAAYLKKTRKANANVATNLRKMPHNVPQVLPLGRQSVT